MGSKKHKKHHRSEKKELKEGKTDRLEKPLKLVLKVGGSSSSVQAPAPASPSIQASDVLQLQTNVIPPQGQQPPQQALDQKHVLHAPASIPGPSVVVPPTVINPHQQQLPIGDPLLVPKEEKMDIMVATTTESHHSHEKHKKSKKKKKKKSSDRDRDKHQKRHKHHHHHHHHREHSHERKEKRRREHDHDHGSKEMPQKRQMVDSNSIFCGGDRTNRDPRSCTLKKKSTKTPLQLLLSYFLKTFQKKDPQQFFAWPVSDIIAPGYSSIISHPMDFSTMKTKVEAKDYKCINDFKNDLKLMCDNAMIYNRPDTVYFKAAKKMWHGQKLFTREQLMSLSRNLPFILDMSPEELGFDPKEHVEEITQLEGGSELTLNESPEMKMKKHKSKHSDDKSYGQSEDDDMAPDEILIQAQKAARAAADKLTLKKPNSQFAFLRQKDDGSTSLSILNPKGAEEKEVKLEQLMGKLGHGGGSITGFKEDPKNVVRPVKNLNYGSFCSYAPQYDSMFSNLTKDESIMVLNTYGDELGAQYAESLMSFAKDCDYVMTMVDNMLDALTGGMHSKTIKQLEERRKTNKTKTPPEVVVNGNVPQEMDFNGADDQSKGPKNVLQSKLDETSALLQDLAKAQHDRLSQAPPSHLSNIQGANKVEVELAEKVTRGLTEITSQVNPGNVIGLQQIRKAMGISYEPIPIVTTNSPSPILIDQDALNQTIDSIVDKGGHKSSIEMMDQDQTSSNKGESNLDCELREFLDSNSVLQGCETSAL